MSKKESVPFKVAWISLSIIGVAILIFGLIAAIWPESSDSSFSRAIGVASIGMGTFGMMISLVPFRRRERWAWFILWYYPIFWVAHFLGRLPPSQDQVHQIIFIVLSSLALLVSIGDFFPQTAGKADMEISHLSLLIWVAPQPSTFNKLST